jgi:hypothetical protein
MDCIQHLYINYAVFETSGNSTHKKDLSPTSSTQKFLNEFLNVFVVWIDANTLHATYFSFSLRFTS